jgi:hypothetical protein
VVVGSTTGGSEVVVVDGDTVVVVVDTVVVVVDVVGASSGRVGTAAVVAVASVVVGCVVVSAGTGLSTIGTGASAAKIVVGSAPTVALAVGARGGVGDASATATVVVDGGGGDVVAPAGTVVADAIDTSVELAAPGVVAGCDVEVDVVLVSLISTEKVSLRSALHEHAEAATATAQSAFDRRLAVWCVTGPSFDPQSWSSGPLPHKPPWQTCPTSWQRITRRDYDQWPT